MHVELAYLVFCSFHAVVYSRSCGPTQKCQCYTESEMDCSSSNLTLIQMCKNIQFQTTKLLAEKNNIREVRQADLQGCEHLESLFLGENNIQLLENCTFCTLIVLKHIDLRNNSLGFSQDSKIHLIQFPSQLTNLSLSGNVKIPLDANFQMYPDFSYLPELTHLYIDGLPNQSFPDTFKAMTNLTNIVLSGLLGYCNLTHVTNHTLVNLVNVESLNISACNITRIDAGAFVEMKELKILDLSQNLQLGFRTLGNVSYGLQFTKIKSLNASKIYPTFGMGTKLLKQDICYLFNTTISEIVLNNNRIEMFETNTAILVPRSVNILRTEANKFTFAPYLLQVGCIVNMTEFYGNNQNSPHDPSLFDREPQESDEESKLSNQNCPFMDEEFLRNEGEKRKYCNYINASEKVQINKHPPMFPKHLKKVFFASSSMRYRVGAYFVLPPDNELEWLDVSGNVLYSLEGPFGPLPNVKQIDISKNYCTFISLKFFEELKTVSNLQLQQNFLGMMFINESHGSQVFQNLAQVETLNLSSNIISDLPKSVFSKMYALETLDLSVNNIEKWNIEVDNLHNLLNLDLRTNFFQTLPMDIAKKLEYNAMRLNRSFTINMKNNSIEVNCMKRKFLQWMVQHRNNFYAFSEYSFKDDSGTSISEKEFIQMVNDLDKKCKSYLLEIVLGSIGTSAFLAVLVGGLVYRNRWNLRYLIRLTKIRHFGYKTLRDYQPVDNYSYDAFISYANEDLDFVLHQVFPCLKDRGLRLCLHDKDFLPGDNISDNIIRAIRNSRTTVVLLSTKFLESKWCLYEFNMARMETIYSRSGSNCLLIIMYEDVSNKNMPTEMLEWIRNNTYLEYTSDEPGVQIFWDNLYHALHT